MNKARIDYPKYVPYVALGTVYLVWGSTTAFIKIGVETFPSVVFPCLRFLISGLLLLIFCFCRGERLPNWKNLKAHLIIALLLFVLGNGVLYWVLHYVTTGFGGLIGAMTPLWMVVFSSVLPPREKIEPVAWLGILISFMGMMLLFLPQVQQPSQGTPAFTFSIMALLMMTICWSLGSIYTRKQQCEDSLLMRVGIQNFFAGLILLPFCFLLVPDWHKIHPSLLSIEALLYLIVMGTIVTTPCYLYVLKALPVSISSTFAYVTPLFTLLFGFLFLHEAVTPMMLIAAAIILAGVVIVQTRS